MINTINLPSPTLSLKDSHATAVQVAIRVRPLTENDQAQSRMSHSSDSNVIKTIGNTVTIVPHHKSFQFDYVFDTESAQDQVYTGVVSNLVNQFLDGYNVTILAYGQTSSGKTHTIMGSAGLDQEGIIPRAMSAFFDRLNSTVSSPLPSPSSSSKQPTPTHLDSRFPSSPISSCSPRSPISPTKLRPISTIITNNSYGNSDISDVSRRDSAPPLLWRPLDKSPRNSVHVSFVEIYNEELVDLLNSSPLNERPPTAIREDTKGQIHWTGVKEVHVSKPEEVLRCLKIGTDARATGSTDMNAKSSRSHAIFTVTLKQEKWIPGAPSSSKSSDTSHRQERTPSPVSSVSSIIGMNSRPTSLKIKTRMAAAGQHQQQYGTRDDDGEWVVVHSKLHFVDLAGSERLKRTSAEGDRRKEGININAGLLALGNVISALASLDTSSPPINNRKTTTTTHVPYRDSKLTRMLQDSLGGNAITLMIACISPAEKNLAETSNTIKYAHRARNIKNKAGRNETEDWMTNDNPDYLRSLITQLKFDVKSLKSELPQHHHQPGTATTTTADADIHAQLQQKIWECEQGAQMTSQQQLLELEQLKLDMKSLLQLENKQDQLIDTFEQKIMGMEQVISYLQQQLDLQDTHINQLQNDNQEKTHQVQSAQKDLQDMRCGMNDLGMERNKFNLIVEWLDKLKNHHGDRNMDSLVSFDELQQLHHLWNNDDLDGLPVVAGTLEDDRIKRMDQQEAKQTHDTKIDDFSSAALEPKLIEPEQALEQTTTERINQQHALEDKHDELQVAQQMIEKQAIELAKAQQQLRDTMDLLEQERKHSVVNDSSHLVADLEEKIQVLQHARQLDQQEHDIQLDAMIDDLENSQESCKQQSHMVASLKQTIQNMQQRLDKAQMNHMTNLHQQMDDPSRNHNSHRNSIEWIEEKAPSKHLRSQSTSNTSSPNVSASQTWSDLEPLSRKQTHHDTNKVATTTCSPAMKDQLQQFTDKKIQLMMKILDMETQLRTRRPQFNSEMNTMESDLLGYSKNRIEPSDQKALMPHSPRKLRSASSQPLIHNNYNKHVSTTTSPSMTFPTALQTPCHIPGTDNHMTKSQQIRSQRASSSSSTTFLSTGTQTSSTSTPHCTSSTPTTTISTISSSSESSNSNSSSSNSSQQSTQTTADQYNKMIHALQCQAQVAESNIHAHQDVIHKLERQLSRSEASVRDTKKQLEVLHKEKQAYTLEIKNLRSQVTQMMTQQKACLDESGERRKHLEIALEQERRLKEMAEKARLILENRMEVLMAKKNKFMCF